MLAFIAELKSLNTVVPPNLFTMVAVPAVVVLKKLVCPVTLAIEVMPAVLELTMLRVPSLVTAPTMLPIVATVPSCSVPQEQIKVPPA
jgi:hypothetical protein